MSTKAANKRYRQSEKGRLTKARYKRSEKGRAANTRYNRSDKGKASRIRYDQSGKGKISDARYVQSDKCKRVKAMYRLRNEDSIKQANEEYKERRRQADTYFDAQQLANGLARINNLDLESIKNSIIPFKLECPKCNSGHFMRRGIRNGLCRFVCADCDKHWSVRLELVDKS